MKSPKSLSCSKLLYKKETKTKTLVGQLVANWKIWIGTQAYKEPTLNGRWLEVLHNTDSGFVFVND